MLYDCIYRYTRRDFDKLKNSKVIGILFKDFYESGKFKEMTKTDKTLMRDPEKYIEGAQKILESFQEAIHS